MIRVGHPSGEQDRAGRVVVCTVRPGQPADMAGRALAREGERHESRHLPPRPAGHRRTPTPGRGCPAVLGPGVGALATLLPSPRGKSVLIQGPGPAQRVGRRGAVGAGLACGAGLDGLDDRAAGSVPAAPPAHEVAVDRLGSADRAVDQQSAGGRRGRRHELAAVRPAGQVTSTSARTTAAGSGTSGGEVTGLGLLIGHAVRLQLWGVSSPPCGLSGYRADRGGSGPPLRYGQRCGAPPKVRDTLAHHAAPLADCLFRQSAGHSPTRR